MASTSADQGGDAGADVMLREFALGEYRYKDDMSRISTVLRA